MNSMSHRTWAYLLLVAAPAVIALSAMAYWQVCSEVDRMDDEALRQKALALTQLTESLSKSIEPLGALQSPVLHDNGTEGGAESFAAQYWNSGNRLILASGGLANLPLDAAPPGYADLEFEGQHWRVFTQLNGHRHWLRVAEQYRERNAIKHALGMQLVGNALIGISAFALIACAWLRWMLRALRTLSEKIDERPGKAEPIGANGLPCEFDTVVTSLNSMLIRLIKAPAKEKQCSPPVAKRTLTS
ncbi:MAG: sensor histidine kinase N-terminal domain-containing protein [Dokdonella sp.]